VSAGVSVGVVANPASGRDIRRLVAGASVFGNSSGALLVLAATATGIPVKKLALFEPPVILDAARAASFEPLARELARLAAEGERGAAAERFLTELVQVREGANDVVEELDARPRNAGQAGVLPVA